MHKWNGMEYLTEIKKSKKCSLIPVKLDYRWRSLKYFRNSSRNKFDVLVPKPMEFIEFV